MTAEEFCSTHPQLYHMATAGSLEQIRKHGLLSTKAILDLIEADPEQRTALMSRRRPEMTDVSHPAHGRFSLRDQKPLRDKALEKCLDGMSLPEWYVTLNSRVFMWASRERVEKLLSARAYRRTDQLVLTIDSNQLASKYASEIEVSVINSGATLYVPVRRGKQTFVPLATYRPGKGTKPIVEVTIPYGIPEIAEYIVKSEIRKAALP